MGVVYLVRHGQASADADDYDVLSELGRVQAGLVGRELARREVMPTRVVTGSLRRQQETARLALTAAGWEVSLSRDDAWDEFDHLDLVAAYDKAAGLADLPQSPARRIEAALPRWGSGKYDADYLETYSDFSARVHAGLERAAEAAGSGETVIVFTSAGAIAAALVALLGVGEPQWQAFNRTAPNGGFSCVVRGRRGHTVVSINEQAHLLPGNVTYR
ncbi:histidine phosphatase family protein [Streptomyces hirsutus]|uniref:histidine phosphatase family protein n=1 Tax=Streptomyces hirsutus TaxID=35620 RepID=UPI0034431BBE